MRVSEYGVYVNKKIEIRVYQNSHSKYLENLRRLFLLEDDEKVVVAWSVVGGDGDHLPAFLEKRLQIMLAGTVGLDDK
jgi:hypothetical protein